MLVLTSWPASGRKVYSFMEEHGHWDDDLERFLYQVASISTEDELTYQDSLAMYNVAGKKLSQRGFTHSFIPVCDRRMPHEPTF